MFRIALKNLWARRRVNIWIFLELVIVTVVGWLLVNPTVVNLVDVSRPVGFDMDRLVIFKLSRLFDDAEVFVSDRGDRASLDADEKALADRIRQDSRIQSLSASGLTSCAPDVPSGMSIAHLTSEADSTEITVLTVNFKAGSDYFTTMGIKTLPGSPSPEELDNMKGALVITRDVAEKLYPGENPLGKKYGDKGKTVDAVVENVRLRSFMPNNLVEFQENDSDRNTWQYAHFIIARLKDGVDPQAFADDSKWKDGMSVGNWYLSTVEASESVHDRLVKDNGIYSSNLLRMALVIFFLLNVALGVSGIFWMQTRKRIPEAGVMRAFGATPRYVTRLMILEGVILTVVAWLAGCLLYFQYALKEGLNDERVTFGSNTLYPDDWIMSFPLHFTVISLIVLAIVLPTVCLGIWIPARRIQKVDPAVALHDE